MKIRVNHKIIKLSIIIFIFLFSPPIIPNISCIHILFLYAVIYLFAHKTDYISYLFSKKVYRRFYMYISLYLIYVFVLTFISYTYNPINASNYQETLYKFFQSIIELPICVMYICTYCDINHIGYKEVLKAIMYAGFYQVIIGLIMLISPTAKYAIVSLMQVNNGKSISDIPTWEYNRRYFAFSDCMLDMYGWGMGIIAIIPLFISENKGKIISFLLSIVLLFNGIINSVTTIVIYLIILLIFYFSKSKKITKKKLLLIICFPLLIILSGFLLKEYFNSTYYWLIREINSIIGNYEGISSVNNLFNLSFWSLPNNIGNLLFGTGHTVYRANGFSHSDVGYVNLIWLSGIIGTLFIIVMYYRFLYKANRFSLIGISLAVAFLAFEIKGNGIANNPGMAVTLLLTYSSRLGEKEENYSDFLI